MSLRPPHPSAFQLDAQVFAELPAAEQLYIESHLKACGRCQELRRETTESVDHFRRYMQPRFEPRQSRAWWRQFTFFGLAPALGVLALLLVFRPLWRSAPVSDAVSLKGGPSLRLYGRHFGKVFQVRDGERLQAGDEIRFSVAPSGKPYLLVVSIDGAGGTSIYFPLQANQSGRLENTDSALLPGSIVLDAAPGPERIFALFSEAPLSADAVKSALHNLAQRGTAAIRATRELPSLKGTTQASVLIEKERP